MSDSQFEPEIVVQGSNNWVAVEDDQVKKAVVPPDTLQPRSTATAAVTTTLDNTSGGSGLSELSKQLRLLQNKNQKQSLEIDKLQRQLRILSELQNVNVNDIRSALELACQAEAYGELQTRITSLRAELEVVQLTTASTNSSSKTDAATATPPGTNMPSPEEVQKGQIMANYELRIGELEELDEQRRQEIHKLYTQLQNQQTDSSQWQSKCDQVQSENEHLHLQLQQLQQEKQNLEKQNQEKQPPLNDVRAVPVDDHDPHRATVEEVQKLQAAHVVAMSQVREAETWSNTVSEKLKLCEQQRDTTENELNLRNVQYKARYLVQEENMNDLRQQLVSLYTAYEFIKEEKDRDDMTRNQLQALLGHADAEVARQVDEIDHYDINNIVESHLLSTPSSIRKSIKSPGSYSRDSTQKIHVVPPESPMLLTDRSTSSTSSLLMQNQPLQKITPIMSGDLLIKDTRGMIKKWRKRHAKLYATVSHFHLDVEEEKGYAIQIGISSVEIYTKYPYGMMIYFGKRSGLSLMVAATNEKDFSDWMSVLTYATTGTDISDGNSNANSTNDEFMLSSHGHDNHNRHMDQQKTPYRRRDGGAQPLSPPTLQEQQASDLELAMELSELEFQSSRQHHIA